jgi:chromate transport protein ChrA
MKIGIFILGCASILMFILPPIAIPAAVMAFILGGISYYEEQRVVTLVFLGVLFAIVGMTLGFVFLFLNQAAVVNSFTIAIQAILSFPSTIWEYFIEYV